MAWPPILPQADRTNLTPQDTSHPGDHNLIATALEDVVDVMPGGQAANPPSASVSFGAADTDFPAGLDVTLPAGRTSLVVLDARSSDPDFTPPGLIVLTPFLNGVASGSGFHVGIAAVYQGVNLTFVARPSTAQTLRFKGRSAVGGTFMATFTVRVVDLGGGTTTRAAELPAEEVAE